jgi:hypothetical protein
LTAGAHGISLGSLSSIQEHTFLSAAVHRTSKVIANTKIQVKSTIEAPPPIQNDLLPPALDVSKSQMSEPKVELACIASTEGEMLPELMGNISKLKMRSNCFQCTSGSMVSSNIESDARPLVDVADVVRVDAAAEQQLEAGWIRDTGIDGFEPIQVSNIAFLLLLVLSRRVRSDVCMIDGSTRSPRLSRIRRARRW